MEGGPSEPTAIPPPALDLEASPLQGQMASAVLDLEGNLVVGGGSELPDAALLFEMLSEVGTLPSLTSFQRMTVSFPNTVRYIVSRDERHVYIVQTRAGS